MESGKKMRAAPDQSRKSLPLVWPLSQVSEPSARLADQSKTTGRVQRATMLSCVR